jgi:transposase
MPFKSQAQSRLFRAAASNPAVAKRVGISVKTAQKFIKDSAHQKTGKLPQHKKAR